MDELELFSSHAQSKYGKQNKCKVCINLKLRSPLSIKAREKLRIRNKEKRANSKDFRDHMYYVGISSKYGLSREDYLVMYEEQQGSCAICGINETMLNGKRLVVDHCHDTGEVRGLLCVRCNTGIGMLQDNAEILASAVDYLSAEQAILA